ncbi:MAG: class II aldolase/adducin family protein [Spirochaetales bacterium]|nr:class II aldolase/adducin family protein [Spirochaetales bacterium]MCF7938326.1 class II aldolase/adducin family protein [Spirochaetales bacterium]
MTALNELAELSRYYGSNPDYVLAGGGNTSYKDEEHLYIKASGTFMADIEEDDFVQMNRSRLDAIWEKTYPPDPEQREAAVKQDLLAARAPGSQSKRPSVETLLHSLLPHRFVLHTHPALVNGLACSKDGEKAFHRLFPEGAVWVPVVNPGYTLAKTIKDAVDTHCEECQENVEIIILQNHGLVVGADTREGLDALHERVMQTIDSALLRQPDLTEVPIDERTESEWATAIRRAMCAENQAIHILPSSNREILRMAGDEKQITPVSSAFTPDHIVYSGHRPLYVQDGPEKLPALLAEYCSREGSDPRIIIVKDAGFFACGNTKREAELARILFLDTIKIAVYAESFGGSRFMPPEHIRFILEWEAEAFRKTRT